MITGRQRRLTVNLKAYIGGGVGLDPVGSGASVRAGVCGLDVDERQLTTVERLLTTGQRGALQ